jgi:hypothetical protein
MTSIPFLTRRRLARSLAVCALVTVAAGCGCSGNPDDTTIPSDKGRRGAAPAPKAELTGAPLSWDVYRAIVPPSLTVTTRSDGVTLERAGCHIVLWRPVATQANADAQAWALFQQIMVSPGQAIVGMNMATPLDDDYRLDGVSGEGWTYVDLRGRLVTASNPNDEYGKVRILLANLGAQSAVITGFQPWNATENCIDDVLNPYEWVLLFYSLSFPSFQGDRDAFRNALVGGWSGAEVGNIISIGWGDILGANGHYLDAFSYETYQQISPTEYLETTSSWSGNGAWDVDGNKLTIWHDDPARPAETRHVRTFSEYGSFTYIRRLDRCEGGVYCEGWSTKDK